MNVIVANEQEQKLTYLDCDIIKSISGQYSAAEIIEMFKNFFYSKMILDVSALKDCNQINSYAELVKGLEPDKIVFLLPEGSSLCTSNFLAKLIDIGIYNFTTTIDGVKYLLNRSNTYNDVEHIKRLAQQSRPNSFNNNQNINSNYNRMNYNESSYYTNNNFNYENQMNNQTYSDAKIIGVKNTTEHAGATTLIYMLKRELNTIYGNENVICIEVDKNDFQIFNDPHMISIKQIDINRALSQFRNVQIILLDINNTPEEKICSDVIYLIEPSTIKLNKLIRRNKIVFQQLNDKKVVLNKSLLNSKDVSDFESEAGIKVYYNMPPLDERKRNAIINDFLVRLNLIGSNGQNQDNKIFGLFRR